MKDIIINEFNEHIRTASMLHNLADLVASSAQKCIESLEKIANASVKDQASLNRGLEEAVL